MQYHRLIHDNCTKYIHISGNLSLVITDNGEKGCSIHTYTNELSTAAVKSLCNDRNKITKEDFEKVKEKVK